MDGDKNRQIAVFRFLVIGDLVGNAELSPGEQERLLRAKYNRSQSDAGLKRLFRATSLTLARPRSPARAAVTRNEHPSAQ